MASAHRHEGDSRVPDAARQRLPDPVITNLARGSKLFERAYRSIGEGKKVHSFRTAAESIRFEAGEYVTPVTVDVVTVEISSQKLSDSEGYKVTLEATIKDAPHTIYTFLSGLKVQLEPLLCKSLPYPFINERGDIPVFETRLGHIFGSGISNELYQADFTVPEGYYQVRVVTFRESK